MKATPTQQTPSDGSDHCLVRRVRTWQQSGTTPAHGKLMVHPSGKACAVDYGRKVRVFWKRDPRWAGAPALPHQYSRQETIPANSKLSHEEGGKEQL
jgi:hypothetical protein